MSQCQAPLLRLGDDFLIENVIRRVDDDANLALTCKRLCALVRLAVMNLYLGESDCLLLASLPISCTYSRCRGVCYHAEGTDDPSLPGLSALLSHLLCWHNYLSEVAVVVRKPSDADPAVRQANDSVLEKLHLLSAISSLRHLQLYKTAPFVADAPQLALLTQLTSLVLADSSYIPGPEAMLQVDLSPLSALRNLNSLAISGVCPSAGYQSTHAAVDSMAAAMVSTGATTKAAGCLPTSITSLLLKHYDELGLQSWLPHILCLTSLRLLHVGNYQEPPGSTAYWSFPAPLLRLLGDRLPSLQDIQMGMDNRGARGRRYPNGDSSLPTNISNLQQLSSLQMRWCQLSIDTAEQWGVLAGLTQLTQLGRIHACCAPIMPYELPALRSLNLSVELWASGMGFNLHTSFSQLRELNIIVQCDRQLLSIAPCIAQCCGLTCLFLHCDFIANLDCINALHGLGTSLQQLVVLNLFWGGGPARWRLPDFSTFTKLQGLRLDLPRLSYSVPGISSLQGIGDAQVLVYLAPLTKLLWLELRGFDSITPALIVGLQALMPQLQYCTLVCCSPEISVLDACADWQGNDVQFVRAALKGGLQFDVYETDKQHERMCQHLPCSVEFVDAHRYYF